VIPLGWGSALYGVIFGALSFGKDAMESTLHLRPVLAAGGTAAFAWLIGAMLWYR